MTADQTSMTKNRWVWIIPAALAVFVTNLAIHILYMVAYYPITSSIRVRTRRIIKHARS